MGELVVMTRHFLGCLRKTTKILCQDNRSPCQESNQGPFSTKQWRYSVHPDFP